MKSEPRPAAVSRRRLRKGVLWIALLCAIGLTGLLVVHRHGSKSISRSTRTPGSQGELRPIRWHGPPLRPLLPPRTQPPNLTGVVMDMRGNPVAQASISALDFEVVGNAPLPIGRAESDREGRFALSLPEGTYQLRGAKSGYGPGNALGRTGEPVLILLPGSATLSGRVLDEAGAPVTRFDVDVVPMTLGHQAAFAPLWSGRFANADGSYQVDAVPEGRAFIVKVSADAYATSFSRPLRMRSGETRTLDFALSQGCVLTGRVVDRRGEPVAYALADAELAVVTGVGSASLATARQVQTDLAGHFSIAHVPSGKIQVRAYDQSHAVTSLTVDVASCDTLDPVEIVVGEGGSLSGVARTESGQPAAGARITLSHRSIGYFNGRTDATGRFHFTGLPAVSLRVELDHHGQTAMVYIPIQAGEETRRDIVLPNAGRGEIRGRLYASGRPLGGATLEAAASFQPSSLGVYRTVSAADGTFVLRNLPEGNYLVHLQSSTLGQGVALGAGGVTEVTLDLHPEPAAAPTTTSREPMSLVPGP